MLIKFGTRIPRGICFAGPRGGGGIINPMLEANRMLLSGRVKEGLGILETAVLGPIKANTFSREHFPVMIKLITTYAAANILSSTSNQGDLTLILLQASEMGTELGRIFKEDPTQITKAEMFQLGAGFSLERVPERLAVFSETAQQLTAQIEALATPAPANTPKEPLPPPAPAPKLTETPRPSSPPPAAKPTLTSQPAKPVETTPPPPPIPTPAIKTKTEKVAGLITRAQGLMENHRYKEAGVILKEALQIDHNHERARFLLNVCAQGLIEAAKTLVSKSPKGAATLIAQAEDLQPTDPEVIAEISLIKSQLEPTQPKPAPAPATPAPASEPVLSIPLAQAIRSAPLSAEQRQAQQLLKDARLERINRRNKALEILLRASSLDPENKAITDELDSLFAEYREIALRQLAANDSTSAKFAANQALRIKPGNEEMIGIAKGTAAKPVPLPRPAPKPMPCATLPKPEKKPTPKERLKNILDKMKLVYGKKKWQWLVEQYERCPRTIGNNVLALSYYLYARLIIKFPFLVDANQYYGAIKNHNYKKAVLFVLRLRNLIRALNYLMEHADKPQKELMSIDRTSYNLLCNMNRVIKISEAREIIKYPPDHETETRIAQELREEFEAIFALEIKLIPKEELAARKREEKAIKAQEKKQKDEGARRQEAIQFFVDHPQATIKDLPPRIWSTLYRRKLLDGMTEAKTLAMRFQQKKP